MLIILLNAIVVFLYFLGCELLVLSSMGPCLADFRCLSNWFLVLDNQNYIFVLNLFFGVAERSRIKVVIYSPKSFTYLY